MSVDKVFKWAPLKYSESFNKSFKQMSALRPFKNASTSRENVYLLTPYGCPKRGFAPSGLPHKQPCLILGKLAGGFALSSSLG